MSKKTLADACTPMSSNIAQKDLAGKEGQYPIYGASGLIGFVDFYKQECQYIAVVKDGAGVGRVFCLPPYSSVIGTLQYLIPKEGVDVNYLSYAIQFMHLEKYYTGATIPHIYFKDYKREPLNLPALEAQQQIAETLGDVDEAIEILNELLSRHDDLVKSRFIEMFGDPVTNPMGWETGTLKELTSKIGSGATPKGGNASYKDEGIALIRSMNVYNGYFDYDGLAHIDDKQAALLDNVCIESGDVLLNITGASVARCCIAPNNILPARVNQHVCILRCKNFISPLFLNYVLTNDQYQAKLWNIAEAGATRQALSKEKIETFSIIMPPIDLQNKFVDFVQLADKSKLVIRELLEKHQLMKEALMQKYFG